VYQYRIRLQAEHPYLQGHPWQSSATISPDQANVFSHNVLYEVKGGFEIVGVNLLPLGMRYGYLYDLMTGEQYLVILYVHIDDNVNDARKVGIDWYELNKIALQRERQWTDDDWHRWWVKYRQRYLDIDAVANVWWQHADVAEFMYTNMINWFYQSPYAFMKLADVPSFNSFSSCPKNRSLLDELVGLPTENKTVLWDYRLIWIQELVENADRNERFADPASDEAWKNYLVLDPSLDTTVWQSYTVFPSEVDDYKIDDENSLTPHPNLEMMDNSTLYKVVDNPNPSFVMPYLRGVLYKKPIRGKITRIYFKQDDPLYKWKKSHILLHLKHLTRLNIINMDEKRRWYYMVRYYRATLRVNETILRTFENLKYRHSARAFIAYVKKCLGPDTFTEDTTILEAVTGDKYIFLKEDGTSPLLVDQFILG